MKSKNIHVLPTDKPSRLFKHQLDEITLNISKHLLQRNYGFNTYITSDEEIKDGEYGICLNLVREGFKSHQAVFKMDAEQRQAMNELGGQKKAEVLKVILTTNKLLIKDGVQAIDDEFLEWFVKNPSCEEVEVNKLCYGALSGFADAGYKIIIPKEEHKQDLPIVNGSYGCIIQTKKQEQKQETLEEFAENYLNKFYSNYAFKDLLKPLLIDGAKWQEQRMYSEEDMKQAFFDGIRVTSEGYNGEYANGENPKIEEQFNKDYKEWFEKFKKK